MKRIILITGGARSGKSTYAENLALELSPTPVYLATARIWDEEFRQSDPVEMKQAMQDITYTQCENLARAMADRLKKDR